MIGDTNKKFNPQYMSEDYGLYEQEGGLRPKLPFTNEDLCYFPIQISAPPIVEVDHLLRAAHRNDQFPHGTDITSTLNELYHDATKVKTSNRQITESALFVDGGAACSSIRTDVAKKLGCAILDSYEAAPVEDYSGGLTPFQKIAYVQVSLPDGNHRHVILCLVNDKMRTPILLGSADKKHMMVNENVNTRIVTIGPTQNPVASIPFM